MPAHLNTPIDYFRLFFDKVIVESFISATNAYGRQNYGSTWGADISIDDFNKFVAITLHIGICPPPAVKHLWQTNGRFYNKYVSKLMGYNKYLRINVALHYVDVTRLTTEEKKEKNKEDPFWLVTPYIIRLNTLFRKYYQCGAKMDIDEMAIKFKGRHIARCYNPNKPNKYHLKAFCLNCASSGYLYAFAMYQGAAEIRPANITATEWPVILLLKPLLELHRNNMVLALDNWYTSIPVALFLIGLNIHLVGTCKSNRKFIERKAILPKVGERGEMIGFEGTVFKDDLPLRSKIYMTGWRDNKPVLMLHTMISFKTIVQRSNKANKKKRIEYTKIDVMRPTIIQLYNSAMGGTDSIDQKNSYYGNLKRGQKWTGRIYKHFMQTAITNAHILFRLHADIQNPEENTLLIFMLTLIDELSGKIDDLGEAKSDSHTPVKVNQGSRRKCKYCTNVNCNTKCHECNLFACIGEAGDDIRSTCFSKHMCSK